MKLPQNSLFAMLLRARWWVSALVALGVFALARLILPEGFALFAALPLIVIAVVVAWKEVRQPRGARLDAALEKLRALSWEEFAGRLEAAYRREGFEVTRVAGAADFELRKAADLTLVAAKRWKASVSGVEPLQELAAAGEKRGASACVYVCATELSDRAKDFATQKQIKRLEGTGLVQLLRP
ncbi:MAG: restriction endonuclease [Burkholderiales bacterium]